MAGMPMFSQRVDADSMLLVKRFDYQSFFDTTAREKAIKTASPGTKILEMEETELSGFGVALTPTSQTPVAVEFIFGENAGSSLQILVPGQTVIAAHPFVALRWGLPFGWLGGGFAGLLVLQSKNIRVEYPKSRPEVVFQRLRMPVWIAGEFDYTDAAILRPNWPTMFPWLGAIRYSTATTVSISQGAESKLSIEPTRTLLRLRLATLAAPGTIRAVLFGSDEFDLDSAGAIVAGDAGFESITWEANAGPIGATPGDQYPVKEYQSGILVKPGANTRSGVGLIFVAAPDLQDEEIDVVRYGRL